MTSRLVGLTAALVLSLCATAAAADPTWHLQIDAGDGFDLTSVSCATPTLCLAVGGSGIAAIEDGSYLYDERPQASASFNAVSCAPATRFCMAADNQGKVVPWRDGAFGEFTKLVGAVELLSVSCTSETFCMAIDNQDMTWQYTGGATWTPRALTKPGTGNVQTKVSCASPTSCVAVTGATDGMRYATWNGTAWSANTSKVNADPADPRSLTCTSSAFCVVTTNRGAAGRFDGTTWTVTQVVANVMVPLTAGCAGTTCRAIDQNVNTYVSTDGVTWTSAGNPRATSLLSAPSSVFCQAVDLCVATSSSNASTFARTIFPTTKPVLSGTGQVGQTLTVAPPPVDETRAWHAEQWWRCAFAGSTCVRIPDAAGTTYKVTADDAGAFLEARDNTGIGLDEEGARGGNPNFVSNAIHVDAPAASPAPAPAPTPAPSPSTAPIQSVPPVAIRSVSTSVKASKKAVTISVRCPGPAMCRGTVKLVLKKKTLGTKRYAASSGKQQSVRITLGRAVQKLLRGHRKVTATLIITPSVGKVVKKTVTLKV